ncbi:MAG: hypothetical protein HYV45_03645 [Candidatus Moranbacteria bacterium]|nr:hypothetical protein [Candidatus Moranbacteria bacterium]
MKLFICGIPGTGKTTIGNSLEKHYGFLHIDLEGPLFGEVENLSLVFFERLVKNTNNIVITWGFPPEESSLEIARYLKDNGFTCVWFDGNREAARSVFKKRGTVSEDMFDIQVKSIDEKNVLRKIRPLCYNTFQENGRFKKEGVIIHQLFHL